MKCQTNQERHQDGERQEKERAKVKVRKEDHIHGARDQVEDVIPAEDHIMQESAQEIRKAARPRANIIIRHRTNGQDGTQGSDRYSGRTGAQVTPTANGAKASQKG